MLLGMNKMLIAQEKCGMDALIDLGKAADPDFAQKVINMQNYISSQINNGGNNLTAPISNAPGTKVIPVLVHIIRETATSPIMTYAQVETQIDALNAAYTATGIQFCLVKNLNTYTVSANGTYLPAEPGVIRYVSNTIANNSITAASTNALDAYCPHAPYDQVMNIWVVKSINGFCGSSIVRGYSPLPLALQANILPGITLDGIVITEAVFGSNAGNNNFALPPNYSACSTDVTIRNEGKVMVHEVGHYLDLWHTFQPNLILNSSGCYGAGVNTDGDFCADTDPVNIPNSTFGGGPPPTNICTGTPIDVANYMYYSNDAVWNSFTTEQGQIMNYWMQNHRAGLYTNANNYKWGLISAAATCRSAGLFADFDLQTSVCIAPNASSTLTITPAIPIPVLNLAISFNWTVTDPSNVVTSSVGTNLIYNFTQVGTYTITCVATDASSNTVSFTKTVTGTNCTLNPLYLNHGNWFFGRYCELQFNGAIPTGIESNAYNNNTFISSEGGYTYSDDLGNLVFYTDGTNVYNSLHTKINTNYPIFSNTGSGPISDKNGMPRIVQSHHGFMACPFPGQVDKYILCSSSGTNGNHGLRYAIIDLISNTVSPEIAFSNQNNVSFGEGLCIVPHCNGRDYWVISRGNNGEIFSYLINEYGVSDYPKVSNGFSFLDSYGIVQSIKCSPQNNLIAISSISANSLAIYNFNNSNGILTNEKIVALPGLSSFERFQGISFSSFDPNNNISNSRLFVSYINHITSLPEIYFLDASIANPLLTNILANNLNLNYSIGYLQIGPDNNIYISKSNDNNYLVNLGVITNLNTLPVFVNTILSNLNMPPNTQTSTKTSNSISIPNLMDGLQPAYTPPSFTTSFTSCTEITLDVPTCWGGYSYDIDWGDGSIHGYSATSVPSAMPHTYASSGTYSITVSFIPCGTTVVPIGAIQVTNAIIVNAAGVALIISGVTSGCVANSLPSTYSVPTVAGATAYNWSISGGGNIVSNAPYGPIVDIEWTTSGTYTVNLSVTNGGCVSTGSLVVDVLVGPVVTLTSAPSCSPVLLEATSTTTNVNYIWSGAGTGSNNTLQANTAGTYVVTGTDADGCQGTTTIVLLGSGPANFCCNANFTGDITKEIYLDNVSATSTFTANAVNGMNIFINGTFNLNKTIVFTDCHFYFTPNANIILNSTILIDPSLIGVNCTFESGCDAMWMGIITTDPNQKIILNTNASTATSLLKDMTEGIIVNKAVINATNTRFEDNYYRVQMKYTTDNFQSFFTNCNFETVNYLKTPYLGAKGMHGITVENCRKLNIGSSFGNGNTFKNLNNGIYIATSIGLFDKNNYELNINYNKFMDITGGVNVWDFPKWANYDPSALNFIYQDPIGCAIYADNFTRSPKMTININGNLSSMPQASYIANFENCNKAAIINATNCWIWNNRATRTNVGFMFNKMDGKSAVASENILGYSSTDPTDGVMIGISKVGNDLSGMWGFHTDNNDIKLKAMPLYNDDNMLTNKQMSMAINSQYYSSNAGNSEAHNNRIIILNDYNAVGIRLENATRSNYRYNKINFTNANIPGVSGLLAGFAIQNAQDGVIANNNIIGLNTANFLNTHNSMGMYISGSKGMLMNCNTADYLRFGIYNIDNSSTGNYDRINSNRFTTRTSCILLRKLVNDGQLGNIGENDPNINIYDANNIYSGTNTWKRVRRFTNSLTCATNKIVTTAARLVQNQSSTTPLNLSCDVKVNDPVTYNYTYTLCPLPELPLVPTPPPAPAMLPYGTCNADAMTVNNTLDLPLARRIAGDSIDYLAMEDGARWADEQLLYQWLKAADESVRTDNPILDSFYIAMNGSNIKYITEFDKNIAQLSDSTIANDSALYYMYLNAAIVANNSINSDVIFETNEKWINGMYLNYLQNGTEEWDIEDMMRIENLANSCPYLEGNAVYKARNMYAMFVPGLFFDNLEICNNAGVFRTKDSTDYQKEEALLNADLEMLPDDQEIFVNNEIKIYPNPADDILNVEYDIAKTSKGEFKIFDVQGNLLQTNKINANNKKAIIQLPPLVKGLYLSQFVENGIITFIGKFVVN
jgi:hypothetical protein